MVNFGGHLNAVRATPRTDRDVYYVPYNDLKEIIFENANDSAQRFVQAWDEALDAACQSFRTLSREVFQSVFEELVKHEGVRGVPLATALERFVKQTDAPTSAADLLTSLTQLHTAALTNGEALRKLVKKYDKYNVQNDPLSPVLLPCLYTSSVYTGQTMLEDCIAQLRSHLEEEEVVFKPLAREDSEAAQARNMQVRMEEIEWLKRLTASLPKDMLRKLVAHRGFHHVQDRNDKRPLENSLSAYETAWTSGIHLCECDIALTKDEKLVLAHDENFTRLALDGKSELSGKRVCDLTLKELIAMPLKCGVRPPLLMDVLRSAYAISDHAKLIIEIKPGNAAAASALARLLIRHPELCSCVEMIMSFDAVTMHRLRTELTTIEATGNSSCAVGGQLGTTHRRVSSMDLGSVALPQQMSLQHRRQISFDHFGSLGTSSRRLSTHDVGMNLSPGDANGLSPAVGMSLSHSGLDMSLRPPLHPSTNNLQTVPDDRPPISNPTSPILSPAIESGCLFPKLMLLTVAGPPKRPCEMRVSVQDLSPVESWLTTDQGSLDGVYLQYEPYMKTKEGTDAMRELSKRFAIGIWGYSGKDPDDFETFQLLVDRGNVSFVNTDLPHHFRKEILRSSTM